MSPRERRAGLWPCGWSPPAVSNGPRAALRSLMLGGRPWPSPSKTARRVAPCRSPYSRLAATRAVRRVAGGHCVASRLLAARRLLPVSDCAQHRSPEFFASSANAKPGPRRWRFGFLRGESIKLRFTNPPPAGIQSRHRERHGDELRGTVQAKAACTGNRQKLLGSESRGPVHKERQIVSIKQVRSEEEMQITLQALNLQFGVDTTPARGLCGSELEAWLNQAEDELFDQLFSRLNERY